MLCIASPVYDFRNHVAAAIGISGPVERMGGTTVTPHKELLRECATSLSEELGSDLEARSDSWSDSDSP